MSSTYTNIARLVFAIFLFPFFLRGLGRLTGSWIRSRTKQRRQLLLQRSATEVTKEGDESSDQQQQQLKKDSSSASISSDWQTVSAAGDKTPPQAQATTTTASSDAAKSKDTSFNGIIGFFHPFANAGGGGERVLFAAIAATQLRYPNALCIVYTGDHDVSKAQILANAQNRFNISINSARVEFLYLTSRDWVLASMWPYATLLGQSLGSLFLAWDALNLCVPDVLIDTMGYAFALWLVKFFFPDLPTAAYVHYPTISTDMLSSLQDSEPGRGVNAGAGKGAKGQAKVLYWKLFAKLYGWVGASIDVVMVNSTWTYRHINSLWRPSSKSASGMNFEKEKSPIQIVYPPCPVQELQSKISVDAESEKTRSNTLLFISQFRPEKNHQLIIEAFAHYLKTRPLTPTQPTPKLILAGSVRANQDEDEKLVYKLRLQAAEPPLKGNVDFVVNAKWEKLLELLRTSSVGVNGMWNEHFGIGVVEYQAAGLVCVVHASGGPKEDIVVDMDDGSTGFHATTKEEFAQAFGRALSLSSKDALALRLRARKNSLRFSEEVFGEAWARGLEKLVDMFSKGLKS